MKILRFLVVGLMLCGLAACNDNGVKIGVVNVARAVDQSNKGKAANAELNAFVKAKRDELKPKAEAIGALQKDLQTVSSTSAKKADEAKLAKAQADYQSLLNSSNTEVRKRAALLRNKVLQELQNVINDIGKQQNFQVILTSANVAYFQNAMDITEQVIKKYDEPVKK